MHDAAPTIADELHLNVARPLDESLEVQCPVAEYLARHGRSLFERGCEFRGIAGDHHPATTAARGRLRNDRVPDLSGDLKGLFGARKPLAARCHGHAAGARKRTRRQLVADLAHGLGCWADEGDSIVRAHVN